MHFEKNHARLSLNIRLHRERKPSQKNLYAIMKHILSQMYLFHNVRFLIYLKDSVDRENLKISLKCFYCISIVLHYL